MREHVLVVIRFVCKYLAIFTTPGMSALVAALALVEVTLRLKRLTALLAR